MKEKEGIVVAQQQASRRALVDSESRQLDLEQELSELRERLGAMEDEFDDINYIGLSLIFKYQDQDVPYDIIIYLDRDEE